MSNEKEEEDPPYPLPHPRQSSAIESWSDTSNEEEEDPPYLPPHQSSAVESWSDMSNEEKEEEEDPLISHLISHQQLVHIMNKSIILQC